jgi:hypothetical protein
MFISGVVRSARIAVKENSITTDCSNWNVTSVAIRFPVGLVAADNPNLAPRAGAQKIEGEIHARKTAR